MPLALVLMMLLEIQKQPVWVVHIVGLLLVTGRLMHAIGVSRAIVNARIVGMVLTFSALIIGALSNIALGPVSAFLANP